MLEIENQGLEILVYALLIPLGLLWSVFVLGIILGGVIVLKSIIFPGPALTWEQMIKDQENKLRYDSLLKENVNEGE